MNRAIKRMGLAAMVAGTLVAAGCGGDNSDNGSNNNEPPVTSSVPVSAGATVTGFIEYLMKLVVSSADMLDPVDVSTFTAPVDNTAEPTPLP